MKNHKEHRGYMEIIKQHVLNLVTLQGVSGREAPVIRYMEKQLKPLVDELKIDSMGNIFTVKRGKRSVRPRLMIAAHSDEIGLIVKSVEDSGFIRFEKAGGVQDNLLQSRMVKVGRHIGIVGAKAGHLSTEKERSEVKKFSDLYIDVGASSREEVESMGIRPGTPVSFVSDPRFFTNQDLIVSKALDDRVGCAVLITLLASLTDEEFNGELHGVITVQEEVGLRGATVSAFAVNPDMALALDTIPSGDTPDVSFQKELPVAIGKGPVFQVMSGSGVRGMFADTTVLSLLEGAAKRGEIPYQLTTFTGGNTDASAMHLARSGVPCGAVTIPRRYSHSPCEMMNLNDAVAAMLVLRELVISIPEKIDWKLPGETMV
ncbi:MAG TPA: M42 family metallopeptidase [Firmicutes bacterium]|nr:M42 family metallopeptidase [Bacillota bacterium]